MPDDHLPDLLREVGTTDAAAVEAMATVVESIARGANPEQAARLVELAHRAPVNRDADEWFWRPFREVDAAFPAADAVPLHSRLADSCTRMRLADNVIVDAALVRLAEFAQWEPATDLLRAAADACLSANANPPVQVAPAAARVSWSQADKKKLESGVAEGVAPALTTLAEILITKIDSAQTASLNAISATRAWTSSVAAELNREHAITQWVMTGVRTDGAPWTELPGIVVAVDSAIELAALLNGAPPRRQHENALLLVLRAAGVPLEASASDKGDFYHEVPAVPPPLASFAPAASALADARALDWTPRDAAVRLLWECVTIAAWTADDPD